MYIILAMIVSFFIIKVRHTHLTHLWFVIKKFGAGLSGYSVHELIEAGEVSGIDFGVLGEKPLISILL